MCLQKKASLSLTRHMVCKTFGVNAQLIIDHAWGYEPCTIAAVKACKPKSKSLSSGQVLKEPYPYDKARIVIREMTDKLVLEMTDKGYETDRMVIDIGYDIENISLESVGYRGDVVRDHYGRPTPAPSHGTAALGCYSCSSRLICDAVIEPEKHEMKNRSAMSQITDGAKYIRGNRSAAE